MENSNSDPVRFAYVGCGFVAQRIHIPNFSMLPLCDFRAVAETREGLGESVADRYRIPKVYRSHEEIAGDPDIEAVGVSAGYSLQGHIAQDLLEAGKHVFMEKPMAVSVRRAREIIAAADRGGGRLMVGYMKRYDSGNLRLKAHLDAWVDSGDAGKIVFARNHGFGGNWVYAQDPNVPASSSDIAAPLAVDECPEWIPQSKRKAYLGYLQQWTHNINLLRFFLGDDGGKSRVVSVDLDPDGMTGLVVLEVNGVRAVVESGYTKYHSWDEHTQIYFEKGWLRTEAPPLMQKEFPATVEVYRSEAEGQLPRVETEYTEASWSYREEARHFIERVRSGEPFRSSGEDTEHDVRLYEDIYRAYLGL